MIRLRFDSRGTDKTRGSVTLWHSWTTLFIVAFIAADICVCPILARRIERAFVCVFAWLLILVCYVQAA